MSFWELFILVGTMATIFGIFVTSYAIINGRNTRKILKEEAEHTREILRKEAEHTREILRKEAEYTREILIKIEQGQNETRREIAEARKEMAEAIKYLANLIVSESEKTRQILKPQP